MSARGGNERPGRQPTGTGESRAAPPAGRLGAALRNRTRASGGAPGRATPAAAPTPSPMPPGAMAGPAPAPTATGAAIGAAAPRPAAAVAPANPRRRPARPLTPVVPTAQSSPATPTSSPETATSPTRAPDPVPLELPTQLAAASRPDDLTPVGPLRTKRQRMLPDPDRALNRRMRTRGPVLFGFLVLLFFAGGGAYWSAVAELEKGATAIGRVIVQTKAKNIQHRSGGKVESILVSEGQTISAGQTILVFDTANAREQLEALRAQLTVSARQTELLAQEIDAYEQLLARQLTTRSRVLQLRRQAAEVEKEAHRLEAQIGNLAREVEQSTVISPVSGRVLRLAAFAPGEVIAPGGIILQLVPAGDSLEIEARLGAQDIAQVHPGMPARVWLSAFSRRESAPLDAKVAWVSPDAVEDQNSGTASYVVRLVLTDPSQVPGGAEALIPGMQAEAMIVTGRKTLLQQLLEPLTRGLSRATRT